MMWGLFSLPLKWPKDMHATAMTEGAATVIDYEAVQCGQVPDNPSGGLGLALVAAPLLLLTQTGLTRSDSEENVVHSPGSRKARWATTLLGAIIFSQGVGKLLDPPGYFAALEPFALFADTVLPPLGLLWMVVELLGGAGLLVAGWTRDPQAPLAKFAAGLAVAVTLSYLLMAGQAYLRGLEIENCTCFGVYLTQRLSGFVLLQDVYMLAYASWQWGTIRRC